MIYFQVLYVLRNIYFEKQRGFDTAVRTQALRILLDNDPSEADVLALVESTTDPYQKGLTSFVLAELFSRAKTNLRLRLDIA